MEIGWAFYTAALGHLQLADRAPMTGITVSSPPPLVQAGLISGIRGRAAGGILRVEELTTRGGKQNNLVALA